MKESTLPSPGVGSKSMHLRRVAATVISSVEVTAPKYPNGQSPNAAGLAAFFDACRLAALETGKLNTVLAFTGAAGVTEIELPGTNQTSLTKGGSAGAATYTSSDPAVATVNASGLVTGVAPGTTTITVSVAATAAYRAATATLTFTVVE